MFDKGTVNCFLAKLRPSEGVSHLSATAGVVWSWPSIWCLASIAIRVSRTHFFATEFTVAIGIEFLQRSNTVSDFLSRDLAIAVGVQCKNKGVS